MNVCNINTCYTSTPTVIMNQFVAVAASGVETKGSTRDPSIRLLEALYKNRMV